MTPPPTTPKRIETEELANILREIVCSISDGSLTDHHKEGWLLNRIDELRLSTIEEEK